MTKEKPAREWLDYTRFYYDENGDKWVNEEDAHRSVAQLAARVKTLEAALRDCRHELITSTNFDVDGGIENLEICEPERQRYESLLKMMLKIDQILKGESE